MTVIRGVQFYLKDGVIYWSTINGLHSGFIVQANPETYDEFYEFYEWIYAGKAPYTFGGGI